MKMERRLILNIVIRKFEAVLEVLSGEDQELLILWDACLVLQLLFHAFDCLHGRQANAYCPAIRAFYKNLKVSIIVLRMHISLLLLINQTK